MEDLDGSWSVSLQAAVANASWTEGAGRGLSRQTQLVLETVMVLMCLCAVTGKDCSLLIYFSQTITQFLKNFKLYFLSISFLENLFFPLDKL